MQIIDTGTPPITISNVMQLRANDSWIHDAAKEIVAFQINDSNCVIIGEKDVAAIIAKHFKGQ